MVPNPELLLDDRTLRLYYGEGLISRFIMLIILWPGICSMDRSFLLFQLKIRAFDSE